MNPRQHAHAIRYDVELHFTPGGPAILGTWTAEAPARRTYREWADRYGGQGGVTVHLIEEDAHGHRRVLAQAHDGETNTSVDDEKP